jgi:diadenosine tetraphosphate (Ap4A) HIT family hydrolase
VADDVVGCLACDLTSGRRAVPGGLLLESGGWRVEHCVGPLGVGTLIVKPVRHLVHVADLGVAESAALGPLLRRVASAVTEVVRPEQVYVCLWSHDGGEPGHLHFVVQPVTRADLDSFGVYGPRLQLAMFDAGVAPDEAEMAALCDRLRPALHRHDGGARPGSARPGEAGPG